MTVIIVGYFFKVLPVALAGFIAGLYVHTAIHGPLNVFTRRESWVIAIIAAIVAIVIGMANHILQ